MIKLIRWYVDRYGVNKYLMRFIKNYYHTFSDSYILAIWGSNEESIDDLNDLFKKGLI